jgi:hypothetical protein
MKTENSSNVCGENIFIQDDSFSIESPHFSKVHIWTERKHVSKFVRNISKAKILKCCIISKIYTKKGERKEYTSNYSNKTKILLFSILSWGAIYWIAIHVHVNVIRNPSNLCFSTNQPLKSTCVWVWLFFLIHCLSFFEVKNVADKKVSSACSKHSPMMIQIHSL